MRSDRTSAASPVSLGRRSVEARTARGILTERLLGRLAGRGKRAGEVVKVLGRAVPFRDRRLALLCRPHRRGRCVRLGLPSSGRYGMTAAVADDLVSDARSSRWKGGVSLLP